MKLRAPYGKANLYRIKITHLFPKTTLFSSFSEAILIFLNFDIAKKIFQKKDFQWFGVLSKTFQPDWRNMATSWAGHLTGQMISLDPVWSALTLWVLICTHIWDKKCVARICDPLALHCWSLLRPHLISKQPNIGFKQTLPSGKCHHPIPSTQSWLFPLRL